jgi:copper homeostasis protein
MFRAAAGRLVVMPGAGRSAETQPAIAGLPLTEVHGSFSSPAPEPAPLVAAFGFQPPGTRRTDRAKVAAMREALDAIGTAA